VGSGQPGEDVLWDSDTDFQALFKNDFSQILPIFFMVHQIFGLLFENNFDFENLTCTNLSIGSIATYSDGF
jgi:hypothetical protein